MIKIQNDIYFSDNRKDMDLELIFNFVKNSYWGKSRTLEEQEIANKNTLNFGLFKNGKQIAFSRVMSDQVFFAYLLDVFVIDKEQGNGYAKILIDKILQHSLLINVDKWMLATKDAHSFYEKIGFELIKRPEILMEKLSERAKQVFEQ